MAPPLLVALAPLGTSTPATSGGSGYIYQFLHLLGVNPSVAENVQSLVLPLVAVLVILVIAALVSTMGARIIRRTMAAASRARSAQHGDGRPARRIDTVGGIVANIWRVVVWVTATLLVLAKLGINLAPFLFGATVIGMTIGFGAQSVVKDFLSGFLLLIEDQYRIGDTVTAAGMTGVVDEVSLRVTRLRAPDGTVWYVPNGDIRELANLTRQWNRTVVDIVIPVGADVEAATAALEEEAKSVYNDPAYKPKCLEPPELLGVTAVSDTGITLEVTVKTVPLAGPAIAREIRLRATSRLTADGILGNTAAVPPVTA
ncbi:MAG TPA: mechanosensitive ion channel family protein [Acidimicrobiales bacterium]|nr:mechanosensitive ion channel family protein [Acidimicrobiales bacterium]